MHPNTNHPAVTSLIGADYLTGNTEERLKHRVYGARTRGVPSQGPFNHTTGIGFVPPHDGDYVDAIINRKAIVKLLVHESLTGAFSSQVRVALYSLRWKRV